jgi:hypothetical protein
MFTGNSSLTLFRTDSVRLMLCFSKVQFNITLQTGILLLHLTSVALD